CRPRLGPRHGPQTGGRRDGADPAGGKRRVRRVALLAVATVIAAACHRETPHFRLGTTTSVQDSALLPYLLPHYEQASGTHVDVIAVGTGAAFKLAQDGNVDLLLVHDRKGEEDFIAAGDGLERRDLMWNTFELLGPANDPAGVRGVTSASAGLAR